MVLWLWFGHDLVIVLLCFGSALLCLVVVLLCFGCGYCHALVVVLVMV